MGDTEMHHVVPPLEPVRQPQDVACCEHEFFLPKCLAAEFELKFDYVDYVDYVDWK
jgi:hypothetical protein